MKTKIKEISFGKWRIMYWWDEFRFGYRDFLTKEEAEEYKELLIKNTKENGNTITY
jgi:hypothetical protein